MTLISRELQSLLKQDTTTTDVNVGVWGGDAPDYNTRYVGTIHNTSSPKYLLTAYLKRRAVGIIFTVVVLILLLTSSIFTDFGFNIGDWILSWFS